MTCMDEQSALRPPPLLRTPGGARTRTSYLLSTPSSTSSSTVSGRGGEGRGGKREREGRKRCVCAHTRTHGSRAEKYSRMIESERILGVVSGFMCFCCSYFDGLGSGFRLSLG